MATVTSRALVEALIEADGYYFDDPRVAEIVEYETVAGQFAWGITWESEPESQRYRYRQETDTVRNPRVIWPESKRLPTLAEIEI